MNIFELIERNNHSNGDRFYCKLRKLKALNPSAFGCKIAFYSKNGKLLYHNSEAYAHELHDPEEIKMRGEMTDAGFPAYPTPKDPSMKVVTWSKQGNMAYVLEYYYESGAFVYDNVFINLAEGYQIRVYDGYIKDEMLTQMKVNIGEFDESLVLTLLGDIGKNVRLPLTQDNPRRPMLDILLGRNKWFY